MADKEATIYIVDVGSSMGAKRNGREQSDLSFAMNYIWEKLSSTVRKTHTYREFADCFRSHSTGKPQLLA